MIAVVITARAQAEIRRIGDYIARDNPLRAASFADELIGHCHRIAAAPEGYALRPERGVGVRGVVHGEYVILYRIENGAIRIRRVVHGAQRPTR